MKVNKDQLEKINMIAILEDLQDQYISELQPELKQVMKQMINRAAVHTRAFIKECDSILTDQNKTDFGIIADEIRVIIERNLLK